MSDFTVADLEAIVKARLADGDAKSYTRTLADKGIDKCAEKFGEEAVEAVIAAVRRAPDELISEAADVVFHLTVLLAVQGVSWSDVTAELERRTGQSGLEEKASRKVAQ
ncbi:phosphoribosyl-ATP diphosphatase [Acuticoccus sp. I52.16.1]|uniref:phosphoribosyl-ATP diphosphatase n=1 Tax=Acuticoccus sp. I52.16.1 TaxID=2928472 RepID=UPI001FD4D0ED|nr:phosphoribosyl-ATP diphosphatase [Acuticoccus sp. I52.16.1]UOM36512.1 phosphoribosyl-ATP diphosphatase [Acuticoccus sp. I52.16.1]